MKNKIVVTAVGSITQNGIGIDLLKKTLTRPVVPDEIKHFDTSGYRVKKSYNLNDFDFKSVLGEKGLRNFNRNTLLILSVLKHDFEEIINEYNIKNARLGLTIGTAFGSLQSISDYELEILDKGPRKINPMGFGNTVINSPASRANIWFGLKALSSTVSCGSVSFAKALEFSINQIENGNVDAMLCGGSEELNMQTFLGYYLNGCLTSADQIAPYGQENGTILAEGCGILLLEKYEDALKNNRKILGTIKGYGTSFHITKTGNPFQSTGIVNSIKNCLKDAQADAGDVQIIVTSANGLDQMDKMEETALLEIFGTDLENKWILPVKEKIGEMMGASGAYQFILPYLIQSMDHYSGFYQYSQQNKSIKKSEKSEKKSLIFKNILLNSVSECGNHSSILIDLN